MFRTVKIILSLIVFILSAAFVILNINTLYTFISICLSLLSIVFLVKLTNGLYTGYLEELNSDVPITLECLTDLFTSAIDSIRIFAGVFSPDIYFRPDIFKTLKAAKTRGVKIEIILSYPNIGLNDLRPKSRSKTMLKNFHEFCGWVKKGNVTLKAISKKKWPHFIVVDNLHVRVEERHKTDNGHKKLVKRRAIAKYLNPILAAKYNKRFESFKNEAAKL